MSSTFSQLSQLSSTGASPYRTQLVRRPLYKHTHSKTHILYVHTKHSSINTPVNRWFLLLSAVFGLGILLVRTGLSDSREVISTCQTLLDRQSIILRMSPQEKCVLSSILDWKSVSAFKSHLLTETILTLGHLHFKCIFTLMWKTSLCPSSPAQPLLPRTVKSQSYVFSQSQHKI